jgi:hypothetical protein
MLWIVGWKRGGVNLHFGGLVGYSVVVDIVCQWMSEDMKRRKRD